MNQNDLVPLMNTITKLEAENTRLKEALEKIASGTEDKIPPFRYMPPDVMKKIAQEALKGE